MIELTTILICLSTFISAWTLGLRIITGDGMVGYPIRRWCFSFGRMRQSKITYLVFQANKRIKKIQGQGSPTAETKMEVESEQRIIDFLKWESFTIEAWHKPLITCAACMCSIHGILISTYFYFLIGVVILYIFPFSIMLSVVINSFIGKRL